MKRLDGILEDFTGLSTQITSLASIQLKCFLGSGPAHSCNVFQSFHLQSEDQLQAQI